MVSEIQPLNKQEPVTKVSQNTYFSVANDIKHEDV